MKTKFYTRLTTVFATLLVFTCFVTAQTTIEVFVSDPNDDSEEQLDDEPDKELTGYIDNGSTDLEICTEKDNVRQLVGAGFRDVQIPAGVTITNAYVQFTSDTDEDEALAIDIWGVAEANTALPITETPFDLTSRPKTTAMVTAWAPVAWVSSARTADQQTPDISAIIAEIIALDGWAPGNNIMIQFSEPSTVKQHREGISYEGVIEKYGGDLALLPSLVVTYTEGTGVNSIKDGSAISIYPNPTRGLLNIDNPSTDSYSFKIYTINGQMVASRRDIAGSTTEVDVSEFAKGVYFVDVISAERTKTQKINY